MLTGMQGIPLSTHISGAILHILPSYPHKYGACSDKMSASEGAEHISCTVKEHSYFAFGKLQIIFQMILDITFF